ncbi:MAG: phosphotransferase [Candidatus Latescibacteria bacterium]|nr:phosphotransferase [Candidatus Latescibacterota bacterium]
MSDRQEAIEAIDKATLTPLVRRALNSEGAEVNDWRCHPIQVHIGAGSDQIGLARADDGSEGRAEKEGHDPLAQSVGRARRQFASERRTGGPGRGVFRFTGSARVQGQRRTWSLMLKIQSDGLQRERLAYESGLLDDLPHGLAIPQCYGVSEQPNGDYWLWLEEVVDEIGPRWPMARYGVAARHLGHFNGTHLAEGVVADLPWLNRKPNLNWNPTYEIIAQLHSVRDHPLIACAFPPDVAAGIVRLWGRRHILLRALYRMPRALCHLDAQRSNMLSRNTDGAEQTVLIDWGSMGIGALGVEIAQLSVSFRSLRDFAMGQVQELADIVFAEYLAGLRDVGWRGDPRALRLGYVTAAVLFNGLGELKSILRGGLDERARPRVIELWGDRSIEENMARRGQLLRFLIGFADEAEGLLGTLPG